MVNWTDWSRRRGRRYGNGLGVLENDEHLTYLATHYPHLLNAFPRRSSLFEAFLMDVHDPRHRYVSASSCTEQDGWDEDVYWLMADLENERRHEE